MPRKPKGDKPLTGAERAKAHRTKAKPPKSELRLTGTENALQLAWDAADESTREAFLDKVLGIQPEPFDEVVVPPPRGIDRTKPLWRNMAALGSLLKGAK